MNSLPQLPISIHPDENSRYFGIGSDVLYTDMPVSTFYKIYHDVIEKCDNEETEEKASDCAKQILKKKNREIQDYLRKLLKRSDKEYRPWLKFELEKDENSKKPLLFKYDVRWESFKEFLETLAPSNDISLEDKYKYISGCKLSGEDLPASTIYSFINRHDTQDASIQVFFKTFENAILQEKNKTMDELEKLYSNLFAYLERIQVTNEESFLANFIPDSAQEVANLYQTIDEGFISSFYRESRSLIERLAWVIIEDIFSVNTITGGEHPAVFLNFNLRWYKWAMEKANERIIRDVRDMDRHIRELMPKLKDEKIDKFLDEIYKNMSTELFLLFAGSEKGKRTSREVPTYPREFVDNGILILKDILKETGISPEDSNPIVQTLFEKWKDAKRVIPPYTTTKFVLELIKKAFNKDLGLMHFWDDYSLFIHPYIFTWQIIPNTSVLEYQILEKEAFNLVNSVSLLITSFIDYFENELRKHNEQKA